MTLARETEPALLELGIVRKMAATMKISSESVSHPSPPTTPLASVGGIVTSVSRLGPGSKHDRGIFVIICYFTAIVQKNYAVEIVIKKNVIIC